MPHDRAPPVPPVAAEANVKMTAAERRATLGLASIFGLRMLGMFIILPVFALYAATLPGGRDHTLVGIALGAYGLTQALLQIPFGWASDRWGRKPVIVVGLLIFAFGSFLAAWAPTIGWTIAGRDRRLFFAGDTAYNEVFKEIGTRLGPFDLAAVPIGAYLPPVIMKPSHTTPEEALQILEDVGGRAMVPIHWGTFALADEPLEEPPRRLQAEAERLGLGPDRVWLFKHGETRAW